VGLFGKLIKPITYEVWEAHSSIHIECVMPSYAITAWWSDYGHAHLSDIICQILDSSLVFGRILKPPIMVGKL